MHLNAAKPRFRHPDAEPFLVDIHGIPRLAFPRITYSFSLAAGLHILSIYPLSQFAISVMNSIKQVLLKVTFTCLFLKKETIQKFANNEDE